MDGQDEYIEVAGYRYLPRSQHKLGEGTYGCVYRGEEISTGRKVAIKKQHPTVRPLLPSFKLVLVCEIES